VPALRPFSTFHVKPFLYASQEAQAEIKKMYIKLSRLHHPDHALTEEARAQAELASSQLNADHALLKSTEALVDFVLSTHEELEVKKTSVPLLAAAYFELQEWLEDNKNEKELGRDKVLAFEKEVKADLTASWIDLESSVKRFPFQGEAKVSGDSAQDCPWNQSDLATISGLFQKYKYMKSFYTDVERKFESVINNAHSN